MIKKDIKILEVLINWYDKNDYVKANINDCTESVYYDLDDLAESIETLRIAGVLYNPNTFIQDVTNNEYLGKTLTVTLKKDLPQIKSIKKLILCLLKAQKKK